MEQFIYRYPLDFDLTERETPYQDPGRIRHGPFFDLIYAASEPQLRASLVRVDFGSLASAALTVTTKNTVNCQLGAVITALQPFAADLAPVFATPGSGFKWRLINDTNRLSAHSYGIAVDINPALGGHWRWSGVRKGRAAAFECYWFIWGGKWHHFDGMHFEYRPELIICTCILSED